jgi:Putative prokaryotic signal transducing protein
MERRGIAASVRAPTEAAASSLRPVESDATAVLTVVSGEPEAQVVCGLLRSAGIECAYRDTEAVETPLEDFIAAGAQEILVREADLEAAKELVAASQGSKE